MKVVENSAQNISASHDQELKDEEPIQLQKQITYQCQSQ